MHIGSLRLRYFRNYSELDFSPSKGLNIIVGENAQGKTNLLEAVFLCGFGRSHRTANDSDMVQYKQGGASVVVNVIDKDENNQSISVKLFPAQPKQIFIDGVRPPRLGELMGCLNIVLFSPESLQLVKGSPSERRRFLDMGISQLGRTYFYRLQQYNIALKQRNALLKNPEMLKDSSHLDMWDNTLAKSGAYIIAARKRYVERIRPYICDIYSMLCDDRECFSLEYVTGISNLSGDLEQALLARLKETRADDIKRGHTSIGAHKDDLVFRTDSQDTKSFASQGQQRSAALAMKLSEISLIESLSGEKPVVLLDDVFSELDERRCDALLQSVSDCQCLITCAKEALAEMVNADFTLFHCVAGNIEQIN